VRVSGLWIADAIFGGVLFFAVWDRLEGSNYVIVDGQAREARGQARSASRALVSASSARRNLRPVGGLRTTAREESLRQVPVLGCGFVTVP
jgi:hypothetical protein